jgi:hypothetical protein
MPHVSQWKTPVLSPPAAWSSVKSRIGFLQPGHSTTGTEGDIRVNQIMEES